MLNSRVLQFFHKPNRYYLKQNMSNTVENTSNLIIRSTAASGSQVYESKRAVHEYLLFHYGQKNDIFPYATGPMDALDFPSRSAKICSNYCSMKTKSTKTRALDIGCAVGGSSFELAKSYDEVIGIDFSQHFIDAANQMKQNGSMNFEVLIRGNVFKTCEANLCKSIDRERVIFKQGDACNLSSDLGKFDVILASNLLCRLPNPRKFLSDIPNFLTPGGCLVLISPYSWLEEYTKQDEWIGSTIDNPDSSNEIVNIFEKQSSMSLVHREDISFLIREHERKYQYGVSHCMIWKKTI